MIFFSNNGQSAGPETRGPRLLKGHRESHWNHPYHKVTL